MKLADYKKFSENNFENKLFILFVLFFLKSISQKNFLHIRKCSILKSSQNLLTRVITSNQLVL